MQELGFEDVEACVLMRQNMAAQYIVMRPILELCKETVHIPGMQVFKRWWEKEVLDLVRECEETETPEEEVGGEETEG